MGGGGVLCRCEGAAGAVATAGGHGKAAAGGGSAALGFAITEGVFLLLAAPLAALTCLRLYKERQAKGAQPMWARLEREENPTELSLNQYKAPAHSIED